MKKHLLILLCLVLFKNTTFAAPIVIPGSAFPIVPTLNNDDRLLVVRTNASPSTNVTIGSGDYLSQIYSGIGINIFSTLYNSNAIQYAVSNHVTSTADLNDLTGMFLELQSDNEVWTNFVDGILFQPRFGTNTSLMGRPVIGNRSNYRKDLWGINLTNGLTLQLPNALSNITIVAMMREPVVGGFDAAGRGQIWSLANTNSKSSIVAADSGQGIWQVQETYRLQEWPGANNGSFSNIFAPLYLFGYDYFVMIRQYGYPMVMGWQRDVNANWRMYQDTIPGKFSINNKTFIYASPTNATDLLSTFQIGYDVTNSPGWAASTSTNLDYASIFIFSTTNINAIVKAYRAAMWALNTDTAEFWYTDSRMSPEGFSASDVPTKGPDFFYQQTLPSAYYFRNYGFGGSKAADIINTFIPNGGFNAISNIPRTKIINVKALFATGINDLYVNGTSSSGLYTIFTNLFSSLNNVGAQIKYCSIFQVATNASVFFNYNLATETNAFVVNQLIRSNITYPYRLQYIPLRDVVPQSVLETNGLFSDDGVHLNHRTNVLMEQVIANMIANPITPVPPTNTAIGPF